MPITRKLIPWNRPALRSAAEYLVAQYTRGAIVELGEVLLIVPGAGAGRRLIELLLDEVEARGVALLPPEIITLGNLPERLYVEQKPFADDLAQLLAWIEALRHNDGERLRQYFPQLPSADRFSDWLPYAEMLSALHRELAADDLDFSDVVTRGSELEGFLEADRWEVLRGIQSEYLRVLDELELWDKQTARLFAIRHRECHTERPIVLVGTVDMNASLRKMLDQVSGHVTSLIFAPAELSQRFDEHGCLMPHAWPHPFAEPRDEQIRVVDRPGDQADEVLRALAELGGQYSPQDVVIGVPDEVLVPYLEQRLESAGVACRYGVGRTIAVTGFGKLMAQLAVWLEDDSLAEFQNLLRHPAIGRFLSRDGVSGDVLTALDDYRGRHLQTRLKGGWLGKAELPREVYARLRELLSDWRFETRPLSAWIAPFAELLRQLAPDLTENERDRREAAEIERAMRAALEKFDRVPETLAPTVSGAAFLHLLLDDIGREPIPPELDPQSVELRGWLELPWEDADVLIVTGMNEGRVPVSQNADLFLPNRLRHVLGLEDNDRRAARDAYALSLMSASRRHLVCIAGRVTAQNDPLIPSRLLFGADRGAKVRRTLQFFREESHARPRPVPGGLVAGAPGARFEPPRLDAYVQAVESMRVTEFRSYLQCPYRYFLRHRLKLQSIDVTAEELDGAAFGNLLHEVLRQFGVHEELREQSRTEPLVEALNGLLNGEVLRAYGDDPSPAIRVQVERARLRLHQFAKWQTEQRLEGWEIRYIEHDFAVEQGAALDVDGVPMPLTGRIDRIDFHPDTDVWRLYDYKSSDQAQNPLAAHYRPRQQRWIDLQLPLYRHLVRVLGIEGDVELAYINLPRKLSDVKHLVAAFSSELLQSADEAARQVVRDVRNNVFWPPSRDCGLMSEFDEICLQSLLADDHGEERSDEVAP